MRRAIAAIDFINISTPFGTISWAIPLVGYGGAVTTEIDALASFAVLYDRRLPDSLCYNLLLGGSRSGPTRIGF
jgi:hypothetical protein